MNFVCTGSEGSAPDSSKTVKCKERFNQVAPGNTCVRADDTDSSVSDPWYGGEGGRGRDEIAQK